jgi:hypothetical protein
MTNSICRRKAGRNNSPYSRKDQTLDHFDYVDGTMHVEQVQMAEIAQQVGTPVYVYSTATLERHVGVFREGLSQLDNPLIAFAVKANPNAAVLATLAKLGLGADVVSGGELQRAVAAGIPADRIVFSGVGKTAEEIAAEGTPPSVVPHKVMPGNKPTTSILATRLTPSVLGQLIALYEHQVFVAGVIWGVDSFDQWGVELGKTQAKALLPVITEDDSPPAQSDSSTDALVRRYRQERGRVR